MKKPEAEPNPPAESEDTQPPATIDETVVDGNDSEPSQALTKQKIHHKILADKRLLVALAILLVLILAGSMYWFVFKDNDKKLDTSKSTQNTKASTAANNTKKSNLPAAVLINGNTYFSAVKTLPDLHLFSDATVANAAEFAGIAYYQVGSTKDKQSIIIAIYSDGPGRAQDYFLGNSDGSYTALLRMNPGYSGYTDDSLAQTVTQDETTKLNDITFPKNVTVANQKLSTNSYSSDGNDFGLGIANLMEGGLTTIRGSTIGPKVTVSPQKIADKDGFTYYRVIAGDSPLYQTEEIYAVFNNVFSVRYVPAGEIASTTDNLAVKWSAGESNVSQYFSGGAGCGNSGYVLASGLSDAQLITVGKTPGGQAIYQLPTSNALVQDIFDKDYSAGQYLSDDSLKNLTIQQMTDKHAYFLAKNGFDEYVLFQRDDMFTRGGCAKPVVYLYPQKTTKVSIKVGAQVTKSDPIYPKDGWRNVIAQPNGKLIYNSKQFSSLYWEGYGTGSYPDISWGTIVKTADAASTVRAQLAQQGLNQTEINDFMVFWEPKLNNVSQPYTRISWLNTNLMNRLAPLNISPLPQTSIRVFLDFEGLNNSYSLPKPSFNAPQRNGFTVVEWGGLMRNGLN